METALNLLTKYASITWWQANVEVATSRNMDVSAVFDTIIRPKLLHNLS